MRRIFVGLSLALCLGCASEGEQEAPKAQTQRERDSVIGASSLPGASGVRGALRVADSAAARRALADSMAQVP